jgi:hypothetical protein
VVETESSRVEIGFEGGLIMNALVTLASAEALERAVNRRAGARRVREALRPRGEAGIRHLTI